MATTKFQKLENLLLSPFSVSGIRNNSREQDMLRCILTSGVAHTGYYQSSGRHAKAIDLTSRISDILNKLGIAHDTGNNALRGGVCGNYVRVTSPAFMKEVNRRRSEESGSRQG